MDINTKTEKDILSVVSIFAEMTDQRKPNGIRYEFESLLILLSLAKLCDQDSPSEITDRVKYRGDLLKQKLDLEWEQMPSQSTWQRLVNQNIDEQEFDEQVCLFLRSLSSDEQKQFYNLDGKVVRSAIDKETGKQLYLLGLQESENNLVVDQTEVKKGENEITAAKRLLDRFDLENKIISGDAMFAQTELSEKIVTKGGEYLWKLRANQGSLYQLAKAHFAKMEDRHMDYAYTVEKGHGRIDEREVWTSFRVVAKMDFPHLEQVFKIRRRSEQVKTGKQSEQEIYGLTSLAVEGYSATEILELSRGHWGIENGLHYRRDVTFKEDKLRQTRKQGGRVLAILNNLTIGILRKIGWENIAKARRYCSALIDEALRLIMTPLDSRL